MVAVFCNLPSCLLPIFIVGQSKLTASFIPEEEFSIDSINKISKGTVISYEKIQDIWKQNNNKSYLFNYNYSKFKSINFGKESSEYKFIISNPIFIKNMIYLIDNKGLFSKYNIDLNKFEWKIKIIEKDKENLAWPASLVSFNNSIITTNGDGSVRCFDTDGNLIWEKSFDMSIRTASIVINDLLLIYLNNGNLIALNIHDGSYKWSFNKENNKISSLYGGKFYEYKNNIIAISPKGTIEFIDYFYAEYSEMNELMNSIYLPLNQQNYDYSILLSIFNNKLIIVENNEFFSTFDIKNKKIEIERFRIPKSKYIDILNDSIFTLDNKNIIRAININNGKIFWKMNLEKTIKSNEKIIRILENNENIIEEMYSKNFSRFTQYP